MVVLRKLRKEQPLLVLQRLYLKTKDEKYFEQILKRFERFLVKYVDKFTNDPHKKEDLLQEARIGLWLTISREFSKESHLVHSIEWGVKSYVRSKFKKEKYILSEECNNFREECFEEAVFTRCLLLDLVLRLTPLQKFVLGFFKSGYSMTEIGKILGVTTSAVSDTFKRIRLKAREVFYA